MMTKAHKLRHVAALIGLCLTLSWQLPAWAASHRDGPRDGFIVMGPDAKDLSRAKPGHGPLVMYVGNPPPGRRSVHSRNTRQARRNSGRHSRARFADADSNSNR